MRLAFATLALFTNVVFGLREESFEQARRVRRVAWSAFDAFREFMLGRGYGLVWAGPEEFSEFMAKSNEDLGNVMRAVGLAE